MWALVIARALGLVRYIKGKEVHEMMYVVTYTGKFGFIKPWTAVRDGETFSQQFLTPSIIEGIEKKLFPELLNEKGIKKIKRHKLSYDTMSAQQEVTQARWWKDTKMYLKNRSILKRTILINPLLHLAFDTLEDAKRASVQHICICRNEDIMLPKKDILQIEDSDFKSITGFELRFGLSNQSFLVGFNRFDDSSPMYGSLEFNGTSLL